MNKKWEFYDVDEQVVKHVAEKNGISELLATVLVNRGIIEDEEVKVFLNPTRNCFYDPYMMPDMEVVVNRILEAVKNQEKVVIYGDYDVDGITSTTVLKKFLSEIGLEADYYIPNRLYEGYGLNMKAIDKIAEEGYKLIITVDCGISGIEEVEYAKKLGIETIITDHHEPLDTLPNAIGVVDAKRKDNKYPFKSLAGVGVVFKLIQALSIKLNLEEKAYLKYLDIVCIGTISDIVPLVDENRVIAKLGLKLVEVTKNPGLRALLDASGYKEINSNTVSFGIAPRINACGRMGQEKEALNLFLTDNIVEAKTITDKLNAYNKERQDIEKRIYNEAMELIEKDNEQEKKSIVLGSENWHHGVIGIVSSKITEMYFKPSILISFEGDEGKGSGRSIAGFDLHDALCRASEYLEKYGGHEMAVGLSLKKENFSKFKEKFEKIVEDANIDDIIPIINIDKQITLKDIKCEVVEELSMLEPFGEANKMPIFLYRNLRIDSIRALSEGKHLKLTLKDGSTIINAIGFNIGHLANEYLIGDKVDILGLLEINTFNGRSSVQINIKDIMKSLK